MISTLSPLNDKLLHYYDKRGLLISNLFVILNAEGE
jgi:hypothetical protein